MEYTVQNLARMAGISSRTLRYYDEIGLLKPARINSSGYRIYAQAEVNRLQLILFYRELEISLEDIKNILNAPSFDELQALKEHRERLQDRKQQLDLLIANVDKTIAVRERGIIMTDKEKFTGFIQKMLDENEQKYGWEIREKYGEESVKNSNKKFLAMTEEQYREMEKLGAEINETLKAAMAAKEPAGDLAQKTADLHRRWLAFTWEKYSKEAHAGLAQMYVDDERFTAYYDQVAPGSAVFLRDAILIYTGMAKQG